MNNLECLEVSDNEIPVSDISDSFTHHSISKGGIYMSVLMKVL